MTCTVSAAPAYTARILRSREHLIAAIGRTSSNGFMVAQSMDRSKAIGIVIVPTSNARVNIWHVVGM